MSSFSLVFPNAAVFKTIGDEILVTPLGGTEVQIDAEFGRTWEDEELLDRFDGEYPWLEVMDEDLHLFKKGTTVTFNGETFQFWKDAPKEPGTRFIILKEAKG